MMLRAIIVTLFTLTSSTLALVHGVDSSTLVSTATYAKAKSEGFTKAVIRGYYEACAAGGNVDPNFVNSYNNARAAGITNIDTYWFPCTGASNSCKSYAKQLSELGATFKAHKMDIGRIWIDFEKDSVCNNWNYGTSRNLAEAKKIIAAVKASGYKFGIYSSPGDGARSSDLTRRFLIALLRSGSLHTITSRRSLLAQSSEDGLPLLVISTLISRPLRNLTSTSLLVRGWTLYLFRTMSHTGEPVSLP